MNEPVNPNPPANPPAPPANPPAPPPGPPAPQPPQGPPPKMEDGGTIKGIDWAGWILGALAFTAFAVIIWKNVRQAKQSKKLADTQESLEARVTTMEKEMAKRASSTGSLIPL